MELLSFHCVMIWQCVEFGSRCSDAVSSVHEWLHISLNIDVIINGDIFDWRLKARRLGWSWWQRSISLGHVFLKYMSIASIYIYNLWKFWFLFYTPWCLGSWIEGYFFMSIPVFTSLLHTSELDWRIFFHVHSSVYSTIAHLCQLLVFIWRFLFLSWELSVILILHLLRSRPVAYPIEFWNFKNSWYQPWLFSVEQKINRREEKTRVKLVLVLLCLFWF